MIDRPVCAVMQSAEAKGLYIEARPQGQGQNGHCTKQKAKPASVSVSCRNFKRTKPFLKKRVRILEVHMATCNLIPDSYARPGQVALPDQKTAMNGARTAGKMHANAAAARVRPDQGDASTAATASLSRGGEWPSGTGQGGRSWPAGRPGPRWRACLLSCESLYQSRQDSRPSCSLVTGQ